MIEKKSKKANLEKRRGLFFYAGLMIAGSMVLLAFEWTSFYTEDLKSQERIENPDITEVIYELPKIPPKPVPKQEQAEVIKEFETKEKIIDETKEITPQIIDEPIEIDIPIDTGMTTVITRVVDTVTYTTYSEAPEFPGGLDKMYTYLSRTIKYPKEELRKGTKGTVWVSFVVSKTGAISDVDIVRSPSKLMSEQATNAVANMPDWIPGKVDGRHVNIRYTLPIKFTPY